MVLEWSSAMESAMRVDFFSTASVVVKCQSDCPEWQQFFCMNEETIPTTPPSHHPPFPPLLPV